MKSFVINALAVIEQHVKEEVKKHAFCFVVWYPGEDMTWNEVSSVAGKNLEPESDPDNKIVILVAKDMGEMKSLWNKFLEQEIHQKAEAYKDGVRFTW